MFLILLDLKDQMSADASRSTVKQILNTLFKSESTSFPLKLENNVYRKNLPHKDVMFYYEEHVIFKVKLRL